MHVFSHLLALLLLVSLALSSLAIGESPCLDPDFEYTPENARLSSYVKAFERWNKDQIEKVPDKYKEIGMMNLFARQHWGGDNFECSVSLGCINRPECPYIFRELSTTILKDRSEVEIRDATRDIWFIVQAVIAINHQMNLIHQLLLAVQENMTAGLARIIGDFTPQADSTKDRQCELAKAAREVVISMLLDALDIGLAFMGVPGGGHIVGAAVNGGKEAAKNAAKEAIKKSQVAAKGAAGYAKVGKHSAEALADIGLNAHAMGQSVPVGSDNDQLRQLSIDAKVCGRDAWSVEENFKRFGQITRNLQVDFTSRRASNHGLINLLNDNMEGNDINTSNISMVRLMETTFWPKLSPKLKQNEALMEQ
ncbi:hypothetical protein PVAG01_04473 [Phlyctema vagabunda]|uniref:Uncharacterized protein n=1 Tax=Phlyctema vagabunda TaxID=108571 RepID=A0ABR4PPC7_9HELO